MTAFRWQVAVGSWQEATAPAGVGVGGGLLPTANCILPTEPGYCRLNRANCQLPTAGRASDL